MKYVALSITFGSRNIAKSLFDLSADGIERGSDIFIKSISDSLRVVKQA